MFSESQLKKAKIAYYNVSECFTFKNGAVWGINSLRDPAVNYQVRLEWTNGKIEDVKFKTVSCECNKVVAVLGGYIPCLGNSKKVCYHSLAVILKAVELAGKKIVFFNSFKDCLNYSNLGGEIIKIRTSDVTNKQYIFAVLKEV